MSVKTAAVRLGRELSDEVVVTWPNQALVGLDRRAVVLGAA